MLFVLHKYTRKCYTQVLHKCVTQMLQARVSRKGYLIHVIRSTQVYTQVIHKCVTQMLQARVSRKGYLIMSDVLGVTFLS